MSLFDVIKYPISDKITTDELNAVPEPIYNYWNWHYGYKSDMPRRIIHSFLVSDGSEGQEKIANLSKVIAEYEPI